mgnify:CR=1 FL=1
MSENSNQINWFMWLTAVVIPILGIVVSVYYGSASIPATPAPLANPVPVAPVVSPSALDKEAISKEQKQALLKKWETSVQNKNLDALLALEKEILEVLPKKEESWKKDMAKLEKEWEEEMLKQGLPEKAPKGKEEIVIRQYQDALAKFPLASTKVRTHIAGLYYLWAQSLWQTAQDNRDKIDIERYKKIVANKLQKCKENDILKRYTSAADALLNLCK